MDTKTVNKCCELGCTKTRVKHLGALLWRCRSHEVGFLRETSFPQDKDDADQIEAAGEQFPQYTGSTVLVVGAGGERRVDRKLSRGGNTYRCRADAASEVVDASNGICAFARLVCPVLDKDGEVDGAMPRHVPQALIDGAASNSPSSSGYSFSLVHSDRRWPSTRKEVVPSAGSNESEPVSTTAPSTSSKSGAKYLGLRRRGLDYASSVHEAESIAKDRTGAQVATTHEEDGGFFVTLTSGFKVFVHGPDGIHVDERREIDVGWNPWDLEDDDDS